MEKRRRTSYLPEETDEDVSLRVGEFREDEGDEPRYVHVYVYMNAQKERERERGESKGRARSGWMHSGYFWIDPDIRRPCFLGPCFKLFRIINELNRIRACRLPALSSIPPRTKTSFTSKFTTPGYLALPTYLPTYPRDKEQKETTRKRGRGGKNIHDTRTNRFILPRWN